jgi:Ca2+-dependent lipid-binding protein
VKTQVDAKNIAYLNENDELSHEIADKKVYAGFTEGSKTFLPTFKVERKAGLHHKKQRTPSYCDRILWKSMPSCAKDVVQEEYGSCEDLGTSDHKPVYASFTITPREKVAINHKLRDGPIVKFSNMKATNVMAADVNGLSDPYIRFYAYPDNLLVEDAGKFSSPKCEKILATLNPTFPDDSMPTLYPAVATKAELAKTHLILAVTDYDMTNEDDLLGTVIFPFSKILVRMEYKLSFFSVSSSRFSNAVSIIHIIDRMLLPRDQVLISMKTSSLTVVPMGS